MKAYMKWFVFPAMALFGLMLLGGKQETPAPPYAPTAEGIAAANADRQAYEAQEQARAEARRKWQAAYDESRREQKATGCLRDKFLSPGQVDLDELKNLENYGSDLASAQARALRRMCQPLWFAEDLLLNQQATIESAMVENARRTP